MILNLANPEESEIEYEITTFPDGQQQVKLLNMPSQKPERKVLIKTRLNNFMDVELLMCTAASLKEAYVPEINLYIPYFLGSRSDRKFETGSNNYLKSVICPIINSLGFGFTTVIDAHSDVLEACLNNYDGINNHAFVQWSVNKLLQHNIILMSPDAGALKKIYKVAEFIDYKGDIITCNKSRGVDGKITKTEVPHFDITKDVVLIDDICDGGRTFIEIAKVIKQRHEDYDREKSNIPPGKIYLVVTHGIFSKGFAELQKYFDGIFCTNSYSDKEKWDLQFGSPSYEAEAKFVNNNIHQFKVI